MRAVCQVSRAGSDWLMRRFPEENGFSKKFVCLSR